MTRRLLVTGASGDIGDAVGRILEEIGGVEAHGADAGDPWPAELSYASVHRLPPASAPNYVDALAELTESIGADLVLPLTEPELSVLCRSRGAGMPLLWSGPHVVETFLDKLSTATWLSKNGFPGPRTSSLSDARAQDLPLVVKPRLGAGGRGVRVVRDAWELEGLRRSQSEPDCCVAQELLLPDDGEVTCAVIRVWGQVRTLQLRRTLSGGLTGKATVVLDLEVERLLADIADRLELNGCLNVQLRMTHKGPRIFEINPRLSSTVRMRHCIGFRDLEWWLSALDERIPPPYAPPLDSRIYRLSREVVVAP